jgi:hypothetical protein
LCQSIVTRKWGFFTVSTGFAAVDCTISLPREPQWRDADDADLTPICALLSRQVFLAVKFFEVMYGPSLARRKFFQR